MHNLTTVIDAIARDVARNKVIDVGEVSRQVLADMDLDRLIAGATLNTRDMTRDERVARRERLNDESRRKRQYRKKQERKAAADDHDDRSMVVADDQLVEGMTIVAPTLRQIDRVVHHYGHRFTNVIGRAHLHEVATNTLDNLARLVMTDEKYEPDTYRVGCHYVATLPGVPDVPRGAPAGAGRFVAMLKRRARFNIIDWHRSNPTLASIEMLSTVEANMYESVDNMLAKGADLNRNPFPLPGKTDTQFLRCVVDAALESIIANGQGVGWLVDMLLDEHQRDSAGRFDWVGNGQEILGTLGMPPLLIDSPIIVGMYAMKASQKVLRHLPGIVRETIVICGDPRLVSVYMHIGRLETINTGIPTFELSEQRKRVIIPEHGTTAQLEDLYAEIDTGLTKAARFQQEALRKHAKELVKVAAEVPTDLAVNEIQAVLNALMDVEREATA